MLYVEVLLPVDIWSSARTSQDTNILFFVVFYILYQSSLGKMSHLCPVLCNGLCRFVRDVRVLSYCRTCPRYRQRRHILFFVSSWCPVIYRWFALLHHLGRYIALWHVPNRCGMGQVAASGRLCQRFRNIGSFSSYCWLSLCVSTCRTHGDHAIKPWALATHTTPSVRFHQPLGRDASIS